MTKQGTQIRRSTTLWKRVERKLNRRNLLMLLATGSAIQLAAAIGTDHLTISLLNLAILILLAVMLQREGSRLATFSRQTNNARHCQADFLTNISHEIRTPMNSIIGFSELLAETPLDEEQSDYVDTILQNSQNLLAMVNDILDFSRIDTAELHLNPELTETAALLGRIERSFFPIARRKGIVFEVFVDADVPPAIWIDEMRLTQCLSNLVSNALKFTHQGQVRLHMGTHREAYRTWLRFDVQDTGIGICDDQKARIFDVFTQADGSASRPFGGLGLGLPLTRRLADMFGGRIMFDSEPGKGSVFTLFVPYMGNGADTETENELESVLQHAC